MTLHVYVQFIVSSVPNSLRFENYVIVFNKVHDIFRTTQSGELPVAHGTSHIA